MTIFEAIQQIKDNYTKAYGVVPTMIYLGKTELLDLLLDKEMILSSTRHVVHDMEVVPVNEKSHVRLF